jgi:glutamate/aspartate transport system substrate-binding protein
MLAPLVVLRKPDLARVPETSAPMPCKCEWYTRRAWPRAIYAARRSRNPEAAPFAGEPGPADWQRRGKRCNVCGQRTNTRETTMKSLAIGITLATAVFATSAIAQDSGTLKKIREANKIAMGVRDSSSPLSYTLGGGQYTGFHVEICQRAIDNIKTALKLPKLEIAYMPVTSQNRIPLMENGTIDIECGSTTNNLARQKQVAFALTTYITEVRMVVKANSGITSIGQLKGRNIATTTGTTSVQHLRKHQRAKGVDFKEIYGKDHADSFLLVESGRADAFVMDDNILAGLVATAKNPAEFKIVGEVLSVEPIAIMMRRDDAPFKKMVDDSIRHLVKSGDYEKLYTKWFLSPIPPRNTSVNLQMGETLKAALKSLNDKPMEEYNK